MMMRVTASRTACKFLPHNRAEAECVAASEVNLSYAPAALANARIGALSDLRTAASLVASRSALVGPATRGAAAVRLFLAAAPLSDSVADDDAALLAVETEANVMCDGSASAADVMSADASSAAALRLCWTEVEDGNFDVDVSNTAKVGGARTRKVKSAEVTSRRPLACADSCKTLPTAELSSACRSRHVAGSGASSGHVHTGCAMLCSSESRVAMKNVAGTVQYSTVLQCSSLRQLSVELGWH